MYFNTINFNDSSNMNFVTRNLNKIGNKVSKPIHYFMGNYLSANCTFVTKKEYTILRQPFFYDRPTFTNISINKSNSNLFKTVAAIVAFIPCLLIFVFTKGVALICSERLRRRYDALVKQSQVSQCEQMKKTLEVSISKNLPHELDAIKQKFTTKEKIDEFMHFFDQEHVIYMPETFDFRSINSRNVRPWLIGELTSEEFVSNIRSQANKP